jgi:hypothetical protein
MTHTAQPSSTTVPKKQNNRRRSRDTEPAAMTLDLGDAAGVRAVPPPRSSKPRAAGRRPKSEEQKAQTARVVPEATRTASSPPREAASRAKGTSKEASSDPLASLKERLRLPGLAQVLKRGKCYELVLADGRRVELGRTAAVMRSKGVECTINDELDVLSGVGTLSSEEWRPFAEQIIHHATVIDDESRPSFVEALHAFVVERRFARDGTPYAVNRKDAADERALIAAKSDAFVDTAGCVYVRFDVFQQWLKKECSLDLTRPGLIAEFEAVGFKRRRMPFDKQVTRRVPDKPNPVKTRYVVSVEKFWPELERAVPTSPRPRDPAATDA